MREQEVKAYIGTENWNDFLKFMYGQTVSLNPDGTTDYYESDVDRFKGRLERQVEAEYDKDFLFQEL